MAEAAIRVSGLAVRRGGRAVIPGIDLEIQRGVVTGLLGPSGCGKTTLMRSIVGVQKITGGSVHVLGLPAGSSTLRSRVGYVTQGASIYSDLTVSENLRYFARICRAGASAVVHAIKTVGLEGFEGHLAGRLSGGQRGRLSLASALLNHPDVLVLDEPTVGLDPLIREQLWSMFRDLAASGTTLLVSSHVMDEAGRCDRLVLMRDGRVLAHQTPAEILATTGAADLNEAFLRLIPTGSAT